MTHTEKDDLVERLKERSQIELTNALNREWWLGQKGHPAAPVIEDMLLWQAATRITELEKALRDAHGEIAYLREAPASPVGEDVVEKVARAIFFSQHNIMHDHDMHWLKANPIIWLDCARAAIAAIGRT